MPSTAVLTPELLVFHHLKSLNYSDKLVERFCQEIKFSPPEKDQKCEVSIQEVLQYYKNATQESGSGDKKRKAEDNGYEDAEEEEFWANKRPKMDLSSTECYGCGKTGHMSRECPDKAEGGGGGGGDCFNCGKPGHFSRECTEPKVHKQPSGLSCYNCGKVGHFSRECPDKASGMKCYNCGQPGHLSKECTETAGANSKMLCYKCNTIGHMARNCDKPRVERPARGGGGFRQQKLHWGSGANSQPLGSKNSEKSG